MSLLLTGSGNLWDGPPSTLDVKGGEAGCARGSSSVKAPRFARGSWCQRARLLSYDTTVPPRTLLSHELSGLLGQPLCSGGLFAKCLGANHVSSTGENPPSDIQLFSFFLIAKTVQNHFSF